MTLAQMLQGHGVTLAIYIYNVDLLVSMTCVLFSKIVHSHWYFSNMTKMVLTLDALVQTIHVNEHISMDIIL